MLIRDVDNNAKRRSARSTEPCHSGVDPPRLHVGKDDARPGLDEGPPVFPTEETRASRDYDNAVREIEQAPGIDRAHAVAPSSASLAASTILSVSRPSASVHDGRSS